MNASGKEVHERSDWRPPRDPIFGYLLEQACLGALPVYFAAVPTARVVRHDPAFRPERSPDGEKVVQRLMADWREGKFHNLWVYPRGDLFVCSDDYFTLAAAERGQPDYLPCWVLGRPDTAIAKDIQGPIDPVALNRMLGIQLCPDPAEQNRGKV
jgi:hypothetical protein